MIEDMRFLRKSVWHVIAPTKMEYFGWRGNLSHNLVAKIYESEGFFNCLFLLVGVTCGNVMGKQQAISFFIFGGLGALDLDFLFLFGIILGYALMPC